MCGSPENCPKPIPHTDLSLSYNKAVCISNKLDLPLLPSPLYIKHCCTLVALGHNITPHDS